MDMSIRFPGADLVLENVGKTLHVFGIDITFYGILISMGMILSLAFIVLEAKRSRENVNHYLDAMILAILFGVAGARALYVGFYWDLYQGDISRIVNIREGGLAIYGGIAGGILAVLLVCLMCRESFWKMADILCLGVLLGQALGRWGDFLNRSSFGEYTEWPTAMQLPLSAVHSSEVTPLMRENMVMIGDVPFIQVHPCFLYESIWCLLLWIILMISRRKKLFDGEIFLRYLAGYSFGRMFIEWLRTDKLLIPGTMVSVNLVISVAVCLFFTIMLVIRSAMARKRIDYRRYRKELKYEYEEKLARQEEERERIKTDTPEEESRSIQSGHRGTALPDDVRSLLEDIEQERLEEQKGAESGMESEQAAAASISLEQTVGKGSERQKDRNLPKTGKTPLRETVDIQSEVQAPDSPENDDGQQTGQNEWNFSSSASEETSVSTYGFAEPEGPGQNLQPDSAYQANSFGQPGEPDSVYQANPFGRREEPDPVSQENPFSPDAARGVPFDMTYEELLAGDEEE